MRTKGPERRGGGRGRSDVHVWRVRAVGHLGVESTHGRREHSCGIHLREGHRRDAQKGICHRESVADAFLYRALLCVPHQRRGMLRVGARARRGLRGTRSQRKAAVAAAAAAEEEWGEEAVAVAANVEAAETVQAAEGVEGAEAPGLASQRWAYRCNGGSERSRGVVVSRTRVTRAQSAVGRMPGAEALRWGWWARGL
eukprot:scaffold14542_cov64-Phaeocystis_antarctica.AAC.1